MKKKAALFLTTSVLTLSSLVTPVLVGAENIDKKIESAQTKIDSIKKEISNTEAALNALKTEIAQAEEQSETIQNNIASEQEKLQRLHSEIVDLQEIIEKRNEKLKQQAVVEQTENSFSNYLSIVLNSESIIDAIERISIVSQLVSSNKEMMDQQTKDKASLEAKEQEAEETLTSLSKEAEALSTLQETLQTKKEDQEVYAKTLAYEKATTEQDKAKLLSEKEAAQRRIEEQRRLEAARKAQLEAEQKALAAKNANNKAVTTGNNAAVKPQQTLATTQAVSTSAEGITAAPASGAKQAAIVSAAMAQIGRIQDCTMLVTNALKAAGINFHGWPAGYLSLGTVVPASQAQPGDLIYYANGGMGLAHIAVYIGNGQAVHGGWNGNQTVVATANVGSGPVFIRVR